MERRIAYVLDNIGKVLFSEKTKSLDFIGVKGGGGQGKFLPKEFRDITKETRDREEGFHSLRHTFATRALECGMDIKTLSEILGHKNPTITLKRYAHSMLEHKTEMMNRLGKLLL